jgi:hypothetical protein
MGSHNVCTHWMYQYYVLYLAWWWLNEPKHVAEFLILITNICCVFDWINYYIIAKHNGMAPIKVPSLIGTHAAVKTINTVACFVEITLP